MVTFTSLQNKLKKLSWISVDKINLISFLFSNCPASEPNLKGRNQLKHRTHRYKPHIDHHPLNPRHYSPNETSSSASARHREAISPSYRPPLEKVFHPGPRGVPLFQSPSMPNININSSRSQVHFPSVSQFYK